MAVRWSQEIFSKRRNENNFAFDSDLHTPKYRKKTFSGTCGGQVSETSGIITTPEWPNRYPYNAKCGWVFQVRCPQYLNQKIVSATKITRPIG